MVAEVTAFSPKRELSKERARALLEGRFTVFDALVGGPLGLDLSTLRCSLCGGEFAGIGRAGIFYEDETMWALHVGCYRNDLEAWADTDDAA